MAFFNSSNEPSAIIAKEDFLLPDYTPTEALHRTNEMETIGSAITPLMHGKSGTNLFLTGPTGTGKTMCMKLIADQIRENSSKVIPIYINCWEFSTKMAVYFKISEALKLVLPRRGLASDEVFEAILGEMKREKIAVLLILDELDSLVFKKEDEFLYNLSRAGIDRGARFGIIGISNRRELQRFLDGRVASSLRFSTFEFKEYDMAQLGEILLERAKFALVPKTYDKAVLGACAKVGAENSGNARLALEILLKAANRAERRDSKKIELEDVEAITKVIETRPNKKAKRPLSFHEADLKLSEEENLLLQILTGGEKSSSEVYDEFIAKKDITKRQIRNYLMLLEAKGLIDTREVQIGENSFLKTKIYTLKIPGGWINGIHNQRGCEGVSEEK